MKLLLLLFPRELRRRHGDEMLEQLANSDRPLRDAADLAATGLRLRFEELHHGGRALNSLGVGLVATWSAGALISDCAVLGSMAIAGFGGLAALNLRHGVARSARAEHP
jgi:hypothetical protein